MKKLSLLPLLLLAACAPAATQTMMGEETAPLAPAEGQKILVGKISIQTPASKEWEGNVELCLSPASNPAKLTCGFTTYLRAKCPLCKEQPNPQASSGFVAMALPAGPNELREVRLTHTNLVVGEHSYTYYFRGLGFMVDDSADITNFGKITLAQKEISATQPPMLTIGEANATNTEGLHHYLARPGANTGASVSKQEKPMFLDQTNFRSQVALGVVTMQPVMVPMYIPARH